MFSIVDIIIILFLLMGAIVGFKRGVIKSATMFLGTIIVLILSFYIKNPVSQIFYKILPFFKIGGVEVFNILIYEAIAFLFVYSILMLVLNILIKVTGIVEKILKFTIILGLPSKILGAIFGLFEQYIYLFLAIFILSRVSALTPFINDSMLAPKIMTSSPLISNLTSEYYQSFQEIYSLKEKYNNTSSKNEYNKEALAILLKYNIITPTSANELISKGKLTTEGLDDIIKQYQEGGV